jgi:hypothetical protein
LINLRLVPGDYKTRPSGSNSWNGFFSLCQDLWKKGFNERLKRLLFGQQPVRIWHHFSSSASFKLGFSRPGAPSRKDYAPKRLEAGPEAEALSNVSWTVLVQMNFDNIGPSPYIFKKGDMKLDNAAWSNILSCAKYSKSYKQPYNIS